jgi:Tfp pilus assembly protein PilF
VGRGFWFSEKNHTITISKTLYQKDEIEKNTAALTVKALTLYSAGNSTQAKGFLDKVLEIEPNNFFAFSLRMKIDNSTKE